MAVTVSIATAEADLSALIERAAAGEEVLIARAGTTVARVVAVEEPRAAAAEAGIDPLDDDIRRVFASRYRA